MIPDTYTQQKAVQAAEAAVAEHQHQVGRGCLLDGRNPTSGEVATHNELQTILAIAIADLRKAEYDASAYGIAAEQYRRNLEQRIY